MASWIPPAYSRRALSWTSRRRRCPGVVNSTRPLVHVSAIDMGSSGTHRNLDWSYMRRCHVMSSSQSDGSRSAVAAVMSPMMHRHTTSPPEAHRMPTTTHTVVTPLPHPCGNEGTPLTHHLHTTSTVEGQQTIS